MKELSIEELEKMTQSKKACEVEVEIVDEAFGDMEPHNINLQVYDGFSYGKLNGKEYYMTYPKKEFIKLASNMDKKIREKLNLADDAEITEVEIMQCYNSVYAL